MARLKRAAESDATAARVSERHALLPLHRPLRAAGVSFRTDEIVTGPGGAQVILDDPSGNPIELFQPAGT